MLVALIYAIDQLGDGLGLIAGGVIGGNDPKRHTPPDIRV
jgi:hypothetical protein